MRYVGLDIHARNFSIAVLDENSSVLFEHSFTTSAANLRTVMEAITDPKRVVLEETTVAAWAYRVLRPHAEQVVVADPLHNRWIAGDESSDDTSAAYKLAQLLRGGFIHPVHHSGRDRQVFKELVLSYHDTSRELVRFKNKLKAKFRQHGVYCAGEGVYHPAEREEWLSKLEAAGARLQMQLLMESIDHFQEQKSLLRKELARRSRALPQIAAFRQVPGVGLIRATTFFALVDTPHRFAHKRKLWAYCGLAVVSRRSDGRAGPEHLNRRGNHLLKDIAKGAALSAIAQKDSQFCRQYQRLIAQGISAQNARLTVARALMATLYAMWRKGESYRPPS